MNLENTKTLEIALINLAFARSELALITNPSDVVRRAIEHIEFRRYGLIEAGSQFGSASV